MKIYDLIERMAREHKSIFDMQLRVTFYARVSTQKEEQLNSKENQVQTFTEMIENNKNWSLVDGYIDTIRGEHAANRDNFQRMISDAKCGKFDLIICKEISRFSRDLVDSISYTRELYNYNVGVFFVSDNLCTIDRDSELRLGIMASIAQQEVARLSDRIKFGHKKAIENGVVMGNSRIFGYVKKDGKLIIDEHEAEMVRMIYKFYSTGDYSLRNISDILYSEGFKNHSGKPISHTTIKAIIQNPKYKGYYCGNKVKIVDYRTKQQKFLPQEEWVMYKDENAVPKIVDEELWQRCNEMLKTRCKSETQGNEGGKRFTSPLSGKIYCAHCNRNYHHNSYGHERNNVQWHWICSGRKEKASSCTSFSIRDSEMISVLRSFFREFIGDMDKYIDKYIRIYEEQSNRVCIDDEISKIKNEIDKLAANKDKLFDLYIDSAITKDDFRERNGKIQQKIDSLESEISNLNEKANNLGETIKQLNGIKTYFSTSVSDCNSISDNLVYELCKNLIEKIAIEPIDKNTANIIFVPKFGDKEEYRLLKDKSRVTIGYMSKKMIESYEMSNKNQ